MGEFVFCTYLLCACTSLRWRYDISAKINCCILMRERSINVIRLSSVVSRIYFVPLQGEFSGGYMNWLVEKLCHKTRNWE